MYLSFSSCIYPDFSTVNKKDCKRIYPRLYIEESCQSFTFCDLLNKYTIINIAKIAI